MLRRKHISEFKKGIAEPLPVMEQFYSLQGEGFWTGAPAYFIRLAGCDVGCHWCDVKESWPAAAHQELSLAEVAARALASGTDRVIITGGEPTIYDLSKLTQVLHEAGLLIHLETSGAHALTGDFDWICFSPKKFAVPGEEFFELADELKIVVFHESDLEWAESLAEKCTDKTLLYLQPEWERRELVTDLIIEFTKDNPKWKLSQQTHKYLGID